MNGLKKFIFSEARVHPNLAHPTMIHPNYIIRINKRYYRVLDDDKRMGIHRPILFTNTDNFGKSIQGWRFDAQEITNERTIKLLNKGKIAYLFLNSDNIEEVV